MNEIKAQELERIKKHLQQKPFTYEEVFDEVLDHYATAYESSELSMDKILDELDAEFTHSRIEEINKKYFNDLKKSLRKNHWLVFLGNFKWPQLINTLIYMVLIILLTPYVIENEWLGLSLYMGFALIPVFFGLFYYFKWVFRWYQGKTRLKNAHAELFGIITAFSVFYIQLPAMGRMFFDEGFELLQYNPLLTAFILIVGMILLITSVKMFTTKMKPALG